MEAEHSPQHWYSTNLVGIPAGLLGTVEFNRHPQPLHIAGARETHSGLFRLLHASKHAEEAAERFAHYMAIAFDLQRPLHSTPGPRRFRPSYLKLLQGWGFDANSPQGAVLKGWVESRFGLTPTFHRAPLGHFPSPAWVTYLEEKFCSRFHHYSIHMQLDLLYEFCQFVIAHFGLPTTQQTLTLWRGVNLAEEPTLGQLDLRAGRCKLRLNNLVSFTSNRERACEFGDWILQVEVPLVKWLLFPGLLQHSPLNGEEEIIALGGEYEVIASYA